MQRTNIIIAICLSLILIGGSGWVRLSRASESTAKLVSVEKEGGANKISIENPSSNEGLANAESPADSPRLTNTTLIGRQLVSDFLDLSLSGQANPESIEGLSGMYADGIENLFSPEIARVEQLVLAPNSKSNLDKYRSELAANYAEHQKLMLEIQATIAQLDFEQASPANADFLAKLGSIYESTSKKILSIQVPETLSDEHLDLVNSILTSAGALSVLVKSDDGATRMAAVIALADGLSGESAAVESINETLSKMP